MLLLLAEAAIVGVPGLLAVDEDVPGAGVPHPAAVGWPVIVGAGSGAGILNISSGTSSP